ncbi:MAG: rod shape-determining protein MreC [Desulfosudaceae bacterium]
MSFKRLLIISGITGGVLIVSLVFLIATSRRSTYPMNGGLVGLFLVAPAQDAVVSTARFARDIWRHYFYLVNTASRNEALRERLKQVEADNEAFKEVALANKRLRNLLEFHGQINYDTFAAEVVARDPSGWFKTVVIDKGSADGVRRNMPVVVSEGIVGQIIDVSPYYSKVLLIIDQNSAVDALCQRTRARGVVKGGPHNRCDFKYVLRKEDVRIGDLVVSSGLDGVYPKGLRIGRVSGLVKLNAGVFQTVEVDPIVNFDKLEEVLVVLTPSRYEFPEKK